MRLSRRDFLKVVVAGVSTAAAGIAATLLGSQSVRTALQSLLSPLTPLRSKIISISVNGRSRILYVRVNSTLLKVLREDIGLRGTKQGCSNSECGACTVLLDGTPVYSCQRLAVEADGRQVTTIEGIASGSELSPLQQAFIDEGAFQCGYCTPGFIVTATALLRSNPHPSRSEVGDALSGNLCRCGSYPHIINAVMAAANGN